MQQDQQQPHDAQAGVPTPRRRGRRLLKSGEARKRRRGGPGAGEKKAWVRGFLAALRNTGNVRLASEKAGVSFGVPYRHRAACERFRRQWDQAIQEACQLLEAVAWKRSTSGEENWTWRWNPETKQHERLPMPNITDGAVLIKLLSAHMPEKYGSRQAVELTGADKGPVEVAATVAVEPDVIVVPCFGADEAELEAAIARAKAKAGVQDG